MANLQQPLSPLAVGLPWLLAFIGVGNLQCLSAQGTQLAGESNAQGMLQKGADFANGGAFEEAIRTWRKAEVLFERSKDRRGQAKVLLDLAAAYENLGQRGQAHALLMNCQSVAQQLADPGLTVAVQCALGTELVSTDPAKGTEVLREALELAGNNLNTQAQAVILNDLGNSLTAQQKYDEALSSFNQCVTLAESTSQPELAVQAFLNAAGAAKDMQDLGRADVLLQKAVLALNDLKASHQVATFYLKAGQIQQAVLSLSGSDRVESRAELTARAEHSFQQADSMAAQLGDQRSVSLAMGSRGSLYEAQGLNDKAQQVTQRAIFAAQSCAASDLLYRWEWQAGRIQRKTGNADLALGAYRRAAKTLENSELRHDILLATSRQGASGFRQYIGPMFYEFADLLLRKAAEAGERQAARKHLLEARNAIELLKSTELDDYFQDPCQTVARHKIRDINSVSPHTAVVYPIVLPDRLELLVGLPGDILERVKTPVGAVELESVVREMQGALRTRTTDDFVGPARQLSHWLMDDLAPLLSEHQVDTLVFVPDGALRMVPMGALFDGTNFLVARYALAITPGLTLMDPHATDWQSPKLLLNGLSEGRMGFEPLPYVNQEIQQVSAAMGGTVLTNQFFTAQRMGKEFARSQYSVVHLATHAWFKRDVSKSYFLTYDAPMSLDDLENLIRPSQFRGRPVELLTLSACQTAVGDDRAALGLAGVAIKAGARSALATLWSVQDEASAKLVSAFYGEIRRNPALSKAKALQAAQLSLINDPNYRHPYYWSPFLIIGNWL